MSKVMLDKWAACLGERKSLAAFWDWLTEQYGNDVELVDLDIEKVLDKYHGIDQVQLDRERRKLVEDVSEGLKHGNVS